MREDLAAPAFGAAAIALPALPTVFAGRPWLGERALTGFARLAGFGATIARFPARTLARRGSFLGLEARDHIHRNHLLGKAFDPFNVNPLSMIYQ